jgi:hypothetical protein
MRKGPITNSRIAIYTIKKFYKANYFLSLVIFDYLQLFYNTRDKFY